MSAEVCGNLFTGVWSTSVMTECASCAVVKLLCSLETLPAENRVLGIIASAEAARMKA